MTTPRETDERGYDVEVVKLVDAVNQLEGITTVASCCGHGEMPFTIDFVAESQYDLPGLLWFFDEDHPWISTWRIYAQTDALMTLIRFVIEGPVGEAAYEEANEIADFIVEVLAGEGEENEPVQTPQ